MVGGAAPHVRPQVTQEDNVGRAGERGKTWAGGEVKITDRLRGKGLLRVGIMEDWSTAVLLLDPGVQHYQYSTVCKGGCRFMVTWVRDEEMRPGGEADNV